MKSGPSTGNVPARIGELLLRRQRAGDPHQRNDHQEAAEEHREAERDVVEVRVGVQPGEGAAVVAGGAGEGVQSSR